MSSLAAKLDVLLNDSDCPADSLLESSRQASAELKQLRQREVQLEKQLRMAGSQLLGDLALQLRRSTGLNVSLTEANCRIGHRERSLIIHPDLERLVWSVRSDSPDFSVGFIREERRSLALADDPASLVEALGRWFTKHCHLDESISGGLLLIDGKTATLLELASWRLRHQPLKTVSIPTRKQKLPLYA